MPWYTLCEIDTGIVDRHILSIEELRAAETAGARARLNPKQRKALDGGQPLLIDGRLFTFQINPPPGSGGCNPKYPIHSLSMACHPSQIGDYAEKSRAAGVPTEFTPDGRPVLTSAAHARAFRKAHNYYDINGYTD